jgi:hypothetical protein
MIIMVAVEVVIDLIPLIIHPLEVAIVALVMVVDSSSSSNVGPRFLMVLPHSLVMTVLLFLHSVTDVKHGVILPTTVLLRLLVVVTMAPMMGKMVLV